MREGRRIRPHLDDKILASWNGLMLGAMARLMPSSAMKISRSSGRKIYDSFRQNSGNRVRSPAFRRSGRLKPELQIKNPAARSSTAGAIVNATTSSCSKPTRSQLSGVIDLYEAAIEPKHLDFAISLAEGVIAKFYDPENGGFWQSAAAARRI